ncbi:hypothetical protein V6N13_149479 [Hibiscus sabdariffa]|uniref:Uncharacterized protein n=1 Tax=Hibiscus sabdariffa TaxID=183260 RepID=A0ABR2EH60_9ROSI
MATTSVQLTNLSGETATLVSSNYGAALGRIRNDTAPIAFQQYISADMNGAVAYNVGNIVTWIVIWTTDYRVATLVLPAGAPVVWKDIADNNLQFNRAENSLRMEYGGKYTSKADISSTPEGQTLNVTISYAPN